MRLLSVRYVGRLLLNRVFRRVILLPRVCASTQLAKDPAKKDELAAILYQSLEAVRIAGVLLSPILPNKMAELHAAIGGPEVSLSGITRASASPMAS